MRSRRGALQTVGEKVEHRRATGIPVVVYNPLGWERSGEVAVDVQVPAQRRVRRADATGAADREQPIDRDRREDR